VTVKHTVSYPKRKPPIEVITPSMIASNPQSAPLSLMELGLSVQCLVGGGWATHYAPSVMIAAVGRRRRCSTKNRSDTNLSVFEFPSRYFGDYKYDWQCARYVVMPSGRRAFASALCVICAATITGSAATILAVGMLQPTVISDSPEIA
jgi:hypothetical protein